MSVKTDLGVSGHSVSTGSKVRRMSSNTDVISMKGGFIDGTPRKRLTIVPPNTPKGNERHSLPTYYEGNVDGAGIVYGLLAALFLYGVAMLLIFWVRDTEAQAFHFVHARGYLGATESEAKEILATTQAIWQRELGRPLTVKSWQSRRNPFQRFHRSLGGRASTLWAWDRYGQRTGRSPIVVMVPPFQEQGLFYLAGLAETCGSAAFAVAEPKNQYGQDRRIHSAITLAHELGHLAGASHDDRLPVSIMNGNVIPFSDFNLKFSEKSLREIRRCKP